MPRFDRLLLPLATAALLIGGTAHAEARRSAQSMPAPVGFRLPEPVKTSRTEPARQDFTKVVASKRDDLPGRSDRGKFDSRRYGNDRDEYERGKEREGFKFEHHHGRGDSPGC